MRSLFVATFVLLVIVPVCSGAPDRVCAQSTISYNNQQVFLNGTNLAWINFAGDLGPSPLDTVHLRTALDSLHAHGANAMRVWLHTNGTQTPQFNTGGRVIGPGSATITNLQKLLDMSWQRRIGLILCLWSFDMERKSIGSLYTNRNELMLAETLKVSDADYASSYTNSYITNALIPMVTAVKAHPGIIAWEIFNEPEGMSNEFGWTETYHVPMVNIQRFVDLCSGAIHRTDSTAQVTNGAWALTAETDVNNIAKPLDVEAQLKAMTPAEREHLENAFYARYGFKETAAQILAPYAAGNYNYYRDDRLIAAGGDADGTLDFYTSHYYDNGQPQSICPLLHPCATYALTKPLVIAEFFPETTVSIPYTDLYRVLYDNGYAGALSWGWYSGASGHSQATLQANILVEVQDLFNRHPQEIQLDQVSGTIFTFTLEPSTIDSSESSLLTWKTALGTAATIDGVPVPTQGTQVVSPVSTTSYTLVTNGMVSDTSTVTLTVNPSGRILSFAAIPPTVGFGEPSKLVWSTSHGSVVSLGGSLYDAVDSTVVNPDSTTVYTLTTIGAVRETSSVTVTTLPADQINRSLYAQVTVSGSSTAPGLSDPRGAIDGDTLTQWESAATSYQWIRCDLGANFTITKVIIFWGPNYAIVFRLLLQPGGGNEFPVFSTSAGSGGTTTIDSINQDGRYVKIGLDIPLQQGTGFDVREFRIFGVAHPVAVAQTPEVIPDRYALLQNFPNPFNPITIVSYELPVVSDVKLAVYDLLGREVEVLVNGRKNAGKYEAEFDGSRFASGVYFYRLTAGPYVESRKMLLIK
jgi:hypothetical protein